MTERNAEMIRRVADRIETNPESYDQSAWIRAGECGTEACIGGHALLEAGLTDTHMGWREFYLIAGSDLLGLTFNESTALFAAKWRPASGMTVPDALRRLADGWPLAVVSETCLDSTLVAERDAWVMAHA